MFLARLKLARGDVTGAAALLAETEQTVRQNNFVHRIPEVAAAQVLILLRQGDLSAAAHLAQAHNLPFSQARVLLAQGDPSAALAVLSPLRQQMEAKGWADEQLKVMVLQAVALHANGEKDKAVQLLSDALVLSEPGGYIRIFVDEGEAMRSLLRLLIEKLSRSRNHPLSGYADKLLAAFTLPAAAPIMAAPKSTFIRQKSDRLEPEVRPAKGMLVEPLSERELEVLKLLAKRIKRPGNCPTTDACRLTPCAPTPKTFSTNWGSTTAGRLSGAPKNSIYSN